MLSLCIPLHNEEEQLPITLAAVVPILESITPEFEIVLVDDGSTDATWQRMCDAAKTDARLRVLTLSRNFGKEAAVCAALSRASGHAVVLMDGDLQHPPELIPRMVELWREGYDVVEGVKTHRGKESRLHRWTANSFYALFKESGGMELRNASDFKLMDSRVVEVWNSIEEHNTFFRGLCAWLGFRRTAVEFEVQPRSAGRTSWNLRGLVRLSIDALTGFSTAPLHLVTFVGVAFWTIAVIIGIDTLVNFFTGHAFAGFTTVILLLLVTGGMIMISLGLIGTYIARIYEEVKQRPRFIVAADNREAPPVSMHLRAVDVRGAVSTHGGGIDAGAKHLAERASASLGSDR